ncbi:VWA domain-containing protein [Thalassobius sp. S69A]|uniref:VWA domain-containing protein n=1 Tax=unclassified Thalassovita TaxID=2619711 RepID=UPI000C39C589|nr:hypothetical protein [Paracoccaceae bacterium]
MRIAVSALLIALLPMPGLSEGLVDLSAMPGAQPDTPPVSARHIALPPDGSYETQLDLSGSALFQLDADDPTALYEISAEAMQPIGLTIELNRLSLNEKGQATKREVLLSDSSLGMGDRVARLRPSLLVPGTYFIGLAAMAQTRTSLRIRRLAAPVFVTDDQKIGPDSAGAAQPGSLCLTPDLPAGTPESPQVHDIALIGAPQQHLELWLTAEGQELARRAGEGRIALTGLKPIENAQFCLRARNAPPDHPGHWRLQISRSDDAGHEVDDNRPSPLPVGKTIQAILDGSDRDTFQLPALPDQRGYALSLQAEAPLRLCLNAPQGEECWTGADLNIAPTVAGDLVLSRGRAEGTRYRLSAREIAIPKRARPEPNQDPTSWPPLDGRVLVQGHLTQEERDSFAFLTGDVAQMWRLQVTGDGVSQALLTDALGETAADIRRNARHGPRLPARDLYLPAGTAQISLRGLGDYRVLAKPLGPPRPNSEREPNDDAAKPRRLTIGTPLVGTLRDGDRDHFGFYLRRAAEMRVTVSPPAGARYELDISSAGRPSSAGFHREKATAPHLEKTVLLPPGEHVLRLLPLDPSPAEYSVAIDYVNPFGDAETAQMSAVAPTLRAFSRFAQSGQLPVTIRNLSDRQIQGRLQGWSADPALHLSAQALTLGPGQVQTVPMVFAAAPDLNAGKLPVFVAITDAQGQALGSAPVAFAATPEAPAQAPAQAKHVPDALRGGINLAQAALGARWLPTDTAQIDETGDYARGNPAQARGFPVLLNGVIAQGTPPVDQEAYLSANNAPHSLAPVLALPEGREFPVAGIAIDTRMLAAGDALHRFAVDLSHDGQSWAEALTGTHDLWGQTAYYTLPDGPRMARFVRLRALDRRRPPTGQIAVNGFEVIAQPGHSGLGPLNLADRRLGGWASGGRQHLLGPGFLHAPIRPDQPANQLIAPEGTADHNVIFSFLNTRSAQLAALEFTYPHTLPDAPNFAATAVVQPLLNTPLDAPAKPVTIGLPTAPKPGEIIQLPWPGTLPLRGLRISFQAQNPETTQLHLPTHIAVLERPEGKDYLSALGTYGQYATQRTPPAPRSETQRAQRVRPLPLNDKFQPGQVEFARHQDIWSLEITQPAARLDIRTQGAPGFVPTVVLRDGTGTRIDPLPSERPDDPQVTLHSFALTAGHYRVEIQESRRNTVFLIDQSPSVLGYLPLIRRGVIDFADALQPGRDRVNFRALGRDWATRDWFSDTVLLRKALATYPREGTSTAEASLIDAADKLQDQEGSRAIVLITDADSDYHGELPQKLAASGARIYVIKVSSGGMWQDPTTAQHAAAFWAGATGGEVWPVLRSEDISTGYARVAARLLGPKSYRIAASAQPVSLEPGRLRVLETARAQNDDPAARPAAMLIIFDASGSMLRRLDGRRRIEIARDSVSAFLAGLSAQSPKEQPLSVGLRVFGGPPESCQTRLAVAPSADLSQTEAQVQLIRPQNKAKTAIGASLRAARQDLANWTGPASILLITDGEETCEGDPLAEIQALRAAGIDTQVDVVSFALDPEIDRATFHSWAQAGGGIFIEADSGADLLAALRETRKLGFALYQKGKLISRGQAGGAEIPLKPGWYEVLFDGAEIPVPVQILPGQETVID